jgi:hypothetical protein
MITGPYATCRQRSRTELRTAVSNDRAGIGEAPAHQADRAFVRASSDEPPEPSAAGPLRDNGLWPHALNVPALRSDLADEHIVDGEVMLRAQDCG